MSVERDLLFGVFAVLSGAAKPQQLVAAAAAWAADREKGLAERLIVEADISRERVAALEGMVGSSVARHEGDVVRALRTVSGRMQAAPEMPKPSAKLLSFGGSFDASIDAPDEETDAEPAATPTAKSDKAPSVSPNVGDPISASTPSIHIPAARPSNRGERLRVTSEQAGRYEVPEGDVLLGAGGIGRVLLTFDSHLGREVAVKELHVDPSEESTDASESMSGKMLRFVREGRVTGQLEHPNIVPVHELGCREDGTFYYTMKVIRGRTLGAALADSKTLKDRIKLLSHFRRICDALAYAHSRGVVHRDLKPDNVMLGEFGETLVVDWGLAKVKGEEDVQGKQLARHAVELREAGSGHTVAGSAIGTPAYMSPEQAEGDVDAIDERSDTWGLGAILYEILTGRPPFTGKHPYEIIGKVMSEAAPSVKAHEPDAPADLAAIADRALSRDPGERYQSASALAADVAAWQDGRAVGAYRYSSFELLKRFVGRNRAASAAAAVVLVSLIVGSALVARAYQQAEKARGLAVAGQSEAERQRTAALSNERAAQDALTEAFLEKAERALDDKEPGSAAIFAAAALVHDPNNPHGTHHSPRGPRGDDAEDQEVERVAMDRMARAYSLYDAAEASRRVRFERDFEVPGAHLISVLASPKSNRVLCASRIPGTPSATARLLDLDSGKQTPLGIEIDRRTPAGWFADGARLAAVETGGTLFVFDGKTGRRLAKHELPDRASAMAVAPSGEEVALAFSDGRIDFVQVSDGATTASMRIASREPTGVSWNDHGLVAVGTSDGESFILRRADTTVLARAVLSPLPKPFPTAGASSFFFTGIVQRIFRMHGDGSVEQTPIVTRPSEIRLSADQELLIHGTAGTTGFGREITLRDPTTLEVQERVRVRTGATKWVGFASEGIVSSGDGPFVRLHRLMPARRPWRPAIERDVNTADWLPNGKLVVTAGKQLSILDPSATSDDPGAAPTRILDVEPLIWRLRAIDDDTVVYLERDNQIGLLSTSDGSVEALTLPAPSRSQIGNGTMDYDGASSTLFYATGTATIQRFDLKTRTHLSPWEGHTSRVFGVHVAPDGRQVVSGDAKGEVLLWPAAGGTPTPLVGHNDIVSGFSFSPDGTKLATSSADRRIIVWDLATKKQIRVLRGHTAWVNRVKYSPDGRYLLSGADDHTARLWDADSGAPLAIYPRKEQVWMLGFTPDGRHVFMNGGSDLPFIRITAGERIQDANLLLDTAERALGMRLEGLELVGMKPTSPTP